MTRSLAFARPLAQKLAPPHVPLLTLAGVRPLAHARARPLALTRFLVLPLALAAILALGGCGGGGPATRAGAHALAAACPGALGPGGAAATRCPYTSVHSIGRRGEGVLRCPEALAFAPDGDLYVADQFSHLVQRFSPVGRFLGQWGSYGSGPGQLGAVDGLAVAPDGDVYALDSTHDRVERFSAAGRLLGEWGSPGRALGQFDFGPGYGPDKPPGGAIAIGGGYLYVADSANNRIVRFALNGSHPVLWAGPGSGPGQVSSPRGLTVSGGILYVADEGNHRVQALSTQARALDARGLPSAAQGRPVGAQGRSLGAPGRPSAQRRSLSSPGRPLEPQGRALYAEGTFGKGPGQFVNPFGVAVDGGRVYVADDNNNRIAVLTRALRPIEAWNGGGSRFALSYIRAIAASPSGRLFVADTGHERIVVFDRAGRGLGVFGTPGITPGQLIAPLAVAADRAGNVLVAETYGSRSPVYLFDAAPPRHAAGAGAGAGLRYRARIERGGGAIIGSHWFGPSAAAFAPDGSLWITDPANDIVRHLSARGAFLGAVGEAGGAADDPVAHGGPSAGGSETGGSAADGGSAAGAGGLSADGPAARAAADLLAPEGVAVTPSGMVYVADSGHGRIARFSAAGLPLGTLAAGVLDRPLAVAVAPSGDIYVADAGADRVLELNPAGARVRAWGGPGTAPGRFAEPAGIAVDPAGHVFVADRGNARIQEFTAAGHLLAAWGLAGGLAGELAMPAALAIDCRGDVLVADTANNRVQIFAGAATSGVCAAA